MQLKKECKMKKLLILILSLISFTALSQTFTCTCTYVSSYEWDLAGSEIKFKSNLGDTISFVIINGQDIEKKFYSEFWDEDGSKEQGGGIDKSTKNVGKVYMIIYKPIEVDGEGGMTEYNQALSFKSF